MDIPSSTIQGIPFRQITASEVCTGNAPPDPTNACSIQSGSTVDITDYVYSATPAGVSQIDTALLPDNLQTNIAQCDITGAGCSYIGYDFVTDNATRGTMPSYIISTESTLSTDQAILNKERGASIGNISLISGGSGYLSVPNVTIDESTAGTLTVQATAVADIANGAVTQVNLTRKGTGYTDLPTVTFSPPGATATAVKNSINEIVEITVTNGGSGYTTAPTVTIGPPTVSALTTVRATATAIVVGGYVTGINITNVGAGYIATPNVTIDPPVIPATATATIDANGSVNAVTVTNAGAGYTSPPVVTFSPSGATATAILTGDRVSGFTITSAGSGYTSPPTVSLTVPSRQGSVATAKASLTNTPVLVTPPGYRFDLNPISGTPLSTSVVTDVDACAALCDANADCKGFNFRALTNQCYLHGSTTVDLGPTYDSGSNSVSYISEKYVKASEADETIGIIKTTAGGTNPSGLELSNEGSYCQNLPQCNTDIDNLVNNSAIASFSTSDIQSCQFCPIRGFNRTGLIVTNEIGTAEAAANNADAVQKLKYMKNTNTVINIIKGAYSITKWIPDADDYIPAQSIYISNDNTTVNNYGGTLNKNLWFDTSRDWYHDTSAVFNIPKDFYKEYYTSSDYIDTTDQLNITPVDYVTNGVVFKSTSKGGVVNTGQNHNMVIEDRVSATSHHDFWYTCPDGGKSTAPVQDRGTLDAKFYPCKGLKVYTAPKYSAKYNKAIFVLTYIPMYTFWEPLLRGNVYTHNTVTDTYYKISLSAPGLTQDLTTNTAGTRVSGQQNGRGYYSYDVTTAEPVTGLSVGDKVYIDGLIIEELEVVTIISAQNRITLRIYGTTDYPTTVPIGSKIKNGFIKRQFSSAHDNIMLTWYKETNPTWTEVENFESVLPSCIQGDDMHDPYEEYDAYRTLPTTPISQAGIDWVNPRHEYGCTSGCTGGRYLLYNCYVNAGSTYESCDTDNGATRYDTEACKSPLVNACLCQDAWHVCVPGEDILNTHFANPITGLTPLYTDVTSSTKGMDITQNGQRRLTAPNGSYNRWIVERTTTTTIYLATGALNITPAQLAWFPTWTQSRLTGSHATYTIGEATPDGPDGCNPGYGVKILNLIHYCDACKAGTWSPGGHTATCQPCSQGQYCPHGTSAPTPCPAGFFCRNPTIKEPCLLGYYCPQGVDTPISCDLSEIPGKSVTTTLSSAIPVNASLSSTSISVNSATNISPNVVLGITGINYPVKVTSVPVLNSFSILLLVTQAISTITAGTKVIVQPTALYCPVGTSFPLDCPSGYICPYSDQKFQCPAGHWCGSGVYQGTRCPSDQYYLPLNIASSASVILGQTNTDGSHCYQCPTITAFFLTKVDDIWNDPVSSRHRVNANQDGCLCPTDYTWDIYSGTCLKTCGPGKQPNPQNTDCVNCPADTYSDTTGFGKCQPCPTNFNSTVWSGRDGCTCTTTRPDGSTTNGTVSWNKQFGRCQISSCPSNGQIKFYSDCYDYEKTATELSAPATVNYQCLSSDLPDITREDGCYCGNTPSITCQCTTCTTGRTGYTSCSTNRVPSISFGYATSYDATVYGGGFYTGNITRDKTLVDIRLIGSKCYYKFVTIVSGTTSGKQVQPPTYSISTRSVDAVMSATACFTPSSDNLSYVFNGTGDVNCYTCSYSDVMFYKTEDLSKVLNLRGSQVGFSYGTALNGSTVVCRASQNQSQLDTSSPSPWGNDGALDGSTTLTTRVLDYLASGVSLSVWSSTRSSLRSGSTTPSTVVSKEGINIIPDGYTIQNGTVVECQQGTYCIGGVSLPCPLGYYCPNRKTIVPTACTTGSYCPEGSTSDTSCPSGYYCPNPFEKYGCPVGQYFSGSRATSISSCRSCTAGNYCPMGSSSQTQCSSGNFCPAGSGKESLCPEGYYCSNPSSLPIRCPPGTICPAGTSTPQSSSTLTLPNGYYNLNGVPTQCIGNTTPNPSRTGCVACTGPSGSDVWESSIGCNKITCPSHLKPNAQRTKCIR